MKGRLGRVARQDPSLLAISLKDGINKATSFNKKFGIWNLGTFLYPALSYLKERNFNDEIIQKFEIGYSVNAKDNFSKAAIHSRSFDRKVIYRSKPYNI